MFRQLNTGTHLYTQEIDARFKQSGGMPDRESDTRFAALEAGKRQFCACSEL